MSIAGVPGRAGARRRSTARVSPRRVLTVLVLCVLLPLLALDDTGALASNGERPSNRERVSNGEQPEPSIAAETRVALIGDSIFEIADDYLLASVPGDVRLWARGGRRVDDALVDLEEQVAWDPDHVVLELGGNDAITAIWGVPLEETWVAIDTYLAAFPAAECIHVVLMPEETIVETFNVHSKQINEYWRQRGALDPRVRIIEWGVTVARQVAFGGPELTLDSVHPSLDGARSLTESITNSVDGCENPGSVELVAFRDLDDDAVHDPNETVVDIAAASLRPDATAPPITEATYGPVTGSSPTFAAVEPGDYVVSVDVGSHVPLLEPGLGSWSIPARVTAGAVTRVELPLARSTRAISGRVFLDADHDGSVGGDELGIAGTLVDLVADMDGDGVHETVVESTTTGIDGSYSFVGLPSGSQLVRAAAPNLYGQSADPTAGPHVVEGQEQGGMRGIDIGFELRPITVTAEAYLDEDRSGTREPDESSFPTVFFALVEVEILADGTVELRGLLDIGLTRTGIVELSERVPRGATIGLLTLPVDGDINLVTGIEALDRPGGLVDAAPGAHTDLSVGFATIVAQ